MTQAPSESKDHPSETDSAQHQRWARVASIAFWLAAAGVLGAAIWVRFAHITEIGFGHPDEISHWGLSKEILEGNFLLRGRFEPIHWMWGTIGFLLVGDTDYSLKIVSAGVDVLNMLLLFWLGLRLTGGRWAALAVTALYAFTPFIVHLSRWGHPHSTARFAALLTFLLFVKFNDARRLDLWRQYAYLLLAGLVGGAGMCTHMTMALLGPAYVVLLWIDALARSGLSIPRRVLAFVRDSALLTAAFLIVPIAIVAFYYYQADDITPREALSWRSKSVADWSAAHLEAEMGGNSTEPALLQLAFDWTTVALRQIAWATSAESGPPKKPEIYGFLLFGTVPLIVAWALRKRAVPFAGYGPFVLVFLFSFGLARVIGVEIVISSRYFTHVFPFVLLAIVFWIHEAVRDFIGPRTAAVAAVAVCGSLMFIHPTVFPGDPALTVKQDFVRVIHDGIGDKVDAENTILELPYEYDTTWDKYFAVPVYFGKNYIPIRNAPYRGDSLVDLCIRRNVSFIFLFVDMRYSPPAREPDPNKPDFYGMYHEGYSGQGELFTRDKEKHIINDFLIEAGARRIFSCPEGSLFAIDRASLGTVKPKPASNANLLESPRLPSTNWAVDGGAIVEELPAPVTIDGGAHTAYRVTLKPGATIQREDDLAIAPGESEQASVWVWTDQSPIPDGALQMQVFRQGGIAEGDILGLSGLNETPQFFEVEYTFEHPHPSVRILIGNVSSSVQTFHVALPSLVRVSSPGPTPPQ